MGSRAALIAVGLVLVVAVFLAVRPDRSTGDPSPGVPTASVAPTALPTPTVAEGDGPEVIEIVVAGGELTTPNTAEVSVGDEVVLRISSDVADEVHLHGYDLETEVTAGGEGEISFVADSPGVFEVEFHESGLLLLRLTVAP